jgi:hypothetical protein
VPAPPSLEDPLKLLARQPEEEYSLLELALEWNDLVGAEAQLAAALRLFVLTRDPLDWLPDRGSAWATANADGDSLELPVYVTHAETQRRLVATGGDLAAAVGPLCATAVLAAAQCQGIIFAGAYPELAFRGEVPRLLEHEVNTVGLGTPAVSAPTSDWEPIGLGAIQDLVQDAFGPVTFDRSTVGLSPSDEPHAGCPACAGQRFGFPGDLLEALGRMCTVHREQGQELADSRIAQARASNPQGWRAIGKGSARINGLPDPGPSPRPQRRRTPPGRNDPCPCGSGRKYKHCCGA